MPDVTQRVLTVVLVDDHEVVRQGLRAMLQAQGDLLVVAEAESVRQAVAAVDQHRPDVVVIEVRLADESGVEATREIRSRQPATRVLMLTSFDDHEALFSSIMAGASGYVLKQIKGNELVSAVRWVGQGKDLIDPAVTGAVLERVRAAGDPNRDERMMRLSAQEEPPAASCPPRTAIG
jgi:DNA-binding NarL/FixJ family response regulator